MTLPDRPSIRDLLRRSESRAKSGGWHPQGRNEEQDGMAVAAGASLAGPKAGAGRGGAGLEMAVTGGRNDENVIAPICGGTTCRT